MPLDRTIDLDLKVKLMIKLNIEHDIDVDPSWKQQEEILSIKDQAPLSAEEDGPMVPDKIRKLSKNLYSPVRV